MTTPTELTSKESDIRSRLLRAAEFIGQRDPANLSGLFRDAVAEIERLESSLETACAERDHLQQTVNGYSTGEPPAVLEKQRDHWRKQCRDLNDILRNIGECISGHDGHVFDDVHALLEQSQARVVEVPPTIGYPRDGGECQHKNGFWMIGNTRACNECNQEVRAAQPPRVCREHLGDPHQACHDCSNAPKRFTTSDPTHGMNARCDGCGEPYGRHIAISSAGVRDVCPTATKGGE
jgi:hypothetical protein